MAYSLWFMNVTQSKIVESISHDINLECFQCAYIKAVACNVKACYCLVGHHHNWQILGIVIGYLVKDGLDDFFAYPYHIRQGYYVPTGKLDNIF